MPRHLTDFEVLVRDSILTVNTTTKSPRPAMVHIANDEDQWCSCDLDFAHQMQIIFFTDKLSAIDKKRIYLRLGKRKILSFRAIAHRLGGGREYNRQKYLDSMQMLESLANYDAARAAQVIENARESYFF